MKSAVQFLIALFIVLTMVIPTGLAAADESFIVFTGDREEYKYSDPLYVRNNGENRVAYCYNASKKVPPTWQEGGQTVYKIESATAEEFYQMTDENVRVMEPEAFKKAIVRLLSGFPTKRIRPDGKIRSNPCHLPLHYAAGGLVLYGLAGYFPALPAVSAV